MQNPHISVVMPVFNGEKYIEQAVESVLKQTYSDFEFIIVDDGSIDNTAVIAKRYELFDNRIKYIRKRNGGVSSALNAGIREACGSWLAFIGCDDLWLPDKLARQAEAISRDEDVAIVEVGTIAFDENGDRYRWGLPNQVVFGRELVCRQLQKNLFCACSVAVRKDAACSVGVFEEELTSCEDYYIWFKLLYNNVKVVFINDVLVRYRLRSDSLSHDIKTLQKHYSCMLKVYDYISEYKLTFAERRILEKSRKRIIYLLNLHRAHSRLCVSGGDAGAYLFKAWLASPHRIKYLIYLVLSSFPKGAGLVKAALDTKWDIAKK